MAIVFVLPFARTSKRLAIYHMRALRTLRTYVCSESKEKECRRELHLCERAADCDKRITPLYLQLYYALVVARTFAANIRFVRGDEGS